MDSEYLKLAVGDALSMALASVALVKPADPIEYIGLWLAKYVENQQREQEVRVRTLSGTRCALCDVRIRPKVMQRNWKKSVFSTIGR